MAQRDYEEFLESLNANGVKYLIIGAHAVAFYARPRATKDLDILHEPSKQSALRIQKAIRGFFGGADLGITIDDLCNADFIVQLGVAPVRIDLMSAIPGLESFKVAWEKRTMGKYGKVNVAYISLNDLIKNKGIGAREQDKADLIYLNKANLRKKSK